MYINIKMNFEHKHTYGRLMEIMINYKNKIKKFDLNNAQQ